MLVYILLLILSGFVLGALARLAVPGPDPMPWWLTTLIGIGGSIVGGVIARLLLGVTGGFFFAFLGAVLLVILYRRFVQHRGITGPSSRRLPPP